MRSANDLSMCWAIGSVPTLDFVGVASHSRKPPLILHALHCYNYHIVDGAGPKRGKIVGKSFQRLSDLLCHALRRERFLDEVDALIQNSTVGNNIGCVT
jgi:hypothetical protein